MLCAIQAWQRVHKQTKKLIHSIHVKNLIMNYLMKRNSYTLYISTMLILVYSFRDAYAFSEAIKTGRWTTLSEQHNCLIFRIKIVNVFFHGTY